MVARTVLTVITLLLALLTLGLKAGAADNLGLIWSLETVIQKGIEENHVPGAALVLFRDGQVIYCQGYGYADLERGIPVDGERTLFRVASVSKAVTIAAVLQLVEQGLIDLDADVGSYIDWPINNPFPEPVRVRHLLEHTDGFGTRDINTFTLDHERLVPLGDILAEELTPPVVEPGSYIVYGSFGTALAGYLVERVSGISFADYCARYIFDPRPAMITTWLNFWNIFLPATSG